MPRDKRFSGYVEHTARLTIREARVLARAPEATPLNWRGTTETFRQPQTPRQCLGATRWEGDRLALVALAYDWGNAVVSAAIAVAYRPCSRGERPVLTCPVCRRHCTAIYLRERVACRQCLRLTYRIRQLGDVDKPAARLAKAERALAASGRPAASGRLRLGRRYLARLSRLNRAHDAQMAQWAVWGKWAKNYLNSANR